MFFRQICCFSVLLVLSMVNGKLFKQGVTARDLMFCLAIGLVGISVSQYFQLQNFKTLLFQTGVHRLAIWQSIVPVLVTLISIVLRLEPAGRVLNIRRCIEVDCAFEHTLSVGLLFQLQWNTFHRVGGAPFLLRALEFYPPLNR